MTKLSIVQVSGTAGRGGAAGVARALHEGYLRRGHDARLLVGRSPGDLAGVHRFHSGRGLWAVHDKLQDASWPRAAKLTRAVASPGVVADVVLGREDFRFPGTGIVESAVVGADVVQLHNLHGAFFDLRVLPRLVDRAPVVLSPHDAWLTTGHCAHTLGCDRWRSGCGDCPHLRVYPALLRDGTAGNWRRKKEVYSRSSVNVAVPCRWLADVIMDSMLAPAVAELRVIPHGVDLDVFRPGDRIADRATLGIEPNTRLVVFAAQGVRTNEFKDYETFVRALELLGAAAVSPVTAIALGAAVGATRSFGTVTLTDVRSVPTDAVATWLRAADLYVHPAVAETSPLSVLEALACGVPVVASAVGGIPEQLNMNTGRLVPPGDAKRLCDVMLDLLRDDALRAQMGRAASEDAVRRFGIDRQLDAYLGWFEELTLRRQGRR